MITGAHVVIDSKDPEADRAFFRDVLGFPAVDAGGGWLIFALPPAEVAFHPAAENDRHALYFLCDDVRAVIGTAALGGAVSAPAVEERWGIRTTIRLPGGGEIGLYQPKHATAFGRHPVKGAPVTITGSVSRRPRTRGVEDSAPGAIRRPDSDR
jgi:catechol 2,3-dioxygenase-like lactoylglutathione lyase family enzyme